VAHTATSRRRELVRELPVWRGPLDADLALAARADAFSARGWVFELKYDGFRLLAAKDGSVVRLRYRSQKDVTSVFPEVADAIRALPGRRALLDGELVAFGADGRPDFELLRARAFARDRTNATLPRTIGCMFDLLALDDHDLRPLPLLERKARLRRVLGHEHGLVYVDDVEGCGERLLAGARELSLEGVVAKRADSSYLPGYSAGWLKFKIEETADFVIVGIAEPSRATFWKAGLILAAVVQEGLRYVGRVGIGAAQVAVLEDVLPHIRRESPACRGGGPAAIWLEPFLVAEVRFLASSRRGLRHATFVRFRPDKPWSDCVLHAS
jgi:bifunctional non-homologous end joining protein LigD